MFVRRLHDCELALMTYNTIGGAGSRCNLCTFTRIHFETIDERVDAECTDGMRVALTRIHN